MTSPPDKPRRDVSAGEASRGGRLWQYGLRSLFVLTTGTAFVAALFHAFGVRAQTGIAFYVVLLWVFAVFFENIVLNRESHPDDR